MEAPHVDVTTPMSTIRSSVVILGSAGAFVLLVAGAVVGGARLAWIAVGVVLAWILGALVLSVGLHDKSPQAARRAGGRAARDSLRREGLPASRPWIQGTSGRWSDSVRSLRRAFRSSRTRL